MERHFNVTPAAIKVDNARANRVRCVATTLIDWSLWQRLLLLLRRMTR